jgi:hypothetical protein
MYEYETLKPVKVILRTGSGGRGRIMEGMNETWYNVFVYGNVTMKTLA